MIKAREEIIIETDHLILRELRLNDTQELAKILTDPQSMKYYPQPFSLKETEEWIERNINRYKNEGHGLWAVILKEDLSGKEKFLGDCGITIQDIDGEKLPELGYHIQTEYRNRGYATEASRGCIEYAVSTLKLKKLYTYTKEDNYPSRKVAEKNGMSYVKTFKKNVMGEEVSEVLYSIDFSCE